MSEDKRDGQECIFIYSSCLNQDFSQYEHYKTDKDLLDNVEVEHIDIHSLLFQTGYLTVKEMKTDYSFNEIYTECIVGFPNQEVRKSIKKVLEIDCVVNDKPEFL